MNNLLTFWDSIGTPRILVVGDIILDRYTWGNAERVSPEAPVLVLKADSHEVRLGGAASVAGLLRALDVSVTLAGVVGADVNGHIVRRLLQESNIDASLVLDDQERPTTTKQRFIGRAEGKHPHQVLRVDEESDQLLSNQLQCELINLINSRLDEFDAVLISDYAKGVCRGASRQMLSAPTDDCSIKDRDSDVSILQSIVCAAKTWGIPVLIDPARLPGYECYRGATLLKPNRIEAELATGLPVRNSLAAKQAAEQLCDRLDLKAAVITLDRDGMVLFQRGQGSEIFPITVRPICDITGAGDTALAILGLILSDARTNRRTEDEQRAVLEHAVRLANIASGLQVERLGVASIERSEIRSAIHNSHVPNCTKLTTIDELESLRERYRASGKIVVFTNGCFDLLHVGHLASLKEAASFGDVLIVAINSDATVRRLKGPDRPIVGQAERAAMLAGLECVDHVLIFDEPTPHELLSRLRPGVLVKGKTTEEVIGREVVEAYGGSVCIAGFFDGVSTTQLIQKTREISTASAD